MGKICFEFKKKTFAEILICLVRCNAKCSLNFYFSNFSAVFLQASPLTSNIKYCRIRKHILVSLLILILPKKEVLVFA